MFFGDQRLRKGLVAQGTGEYLVIVAVVVLGLVLVSVYSNFSSFSNVTNVSSTSGKVANNIGVESISVVSVVVDLNGEV
ncbi:MAG: hypothetical protein NTY48_00880 [Candidatus Diapherotrites archaeon]|nr:hypothetical protein [Candidatus Diapherotrites archaeon]